MHGELGDLPEPRGQLNLAPRNLGFQVVEGKGSRHAVPFRAGPRPLYSPS
jgi:hypothetical protein